MSQGDRCEVVTSYHSNEDHILTIKAGEPVTLLETIGSYTTWVKCRDDQGRTGQVAVSHLDIYKYEEASDPGDSDVESRDSANEDENADGYDDAYVPSDQRLFLCIRAYTGTDISVVEGEIVVGVEERQYKDQRGRLVRLVERRGVQKQQGVVPSNILEGVPCLEQQRWYVGRVPRSHAEVFLQHAFLNKTFLVRMSSKTEGFVISIKEDGRYRHRKIKRTATGQYTAITGAAYNCVVELIYNHHQHRPKGFKLHHEYDKYGKTHIKALNRLGCGGNPGGELPFPDRTQNR